MGKDKLIKAYSGPEHMALLLKEKLDAAGISSLIKNDSQDAYMGFSPKVVDLYISDQDLEKAGPLISEITNQ
jgi:hypothetical protein